MLMSPFRNRCSAHLCLMENDRGQCLENKSHLNKKLSVFLGSNEGKFGSESKYKWFNMATFKPKPTSLWPSLLFLAEVRIAGIDLFQL